MLVSRRARIVRQVSSGLAYCIVAIIYLYAQSVAYNVFFEACGRDNPEGFVTEPTERVGVGLIIVAIQSY